MQEVAELFRNIRDIKGEIMTLRQHEEYVRMSMLPGAIQYDKDKVKNSAKDPMSKFADKISEDEDRIKKRLKRLERLNIDAERILDEMPTSKYRNLLFLRYIQGGLKYRYSWSEVAINLGYAEHYTKKELHQAALAEAQEIYDKIK